MSEYEIITVSASSSNPTIMPYDGNLVVKANSNARNIFVNGQIVATASPVATIDGSATVEVKKGDAVYFSSYYQNCARIAYYTHPMFIKATTTASSYTPSSAVQEIKDYTKDYVDAKNSYSTEETLTGGTYIDGKPIYKNVVESSSFTTSSPLDISVPNLETLIDAKLKRNYDTSHPNWWVFDGTTSSNNLIVDTSTAGHIVVTPQSAGITIKNFTGTFLYTKTTD